MNDFDQAARFAAKLRPPQFLRWLMPKLDPRLVFRDWLDTRRLPYPGERDRTCDTVADFEDTTAPGRHWAVVVEFESEPDPLGLARLFNYLGQLYLELESDPEKRGKYAVGGALLNLTGAEESDTLEMRLPGREEYGEWLRVVLRTLRTVDGAATLAGIAAGEIDRCLLPWIALMHGAADPGIIKEWRRLADMEEDSRLRRQFGGLAQVFAELARCAPEWKQGLEGWNVGESQVVNEWRAEGDARGSLRTRRADVLRALEIRMKAPPPPEVVKTVESIDSLDELSRWLDAAIAATSLDEFLATIRRS